MTTLEIVLLVLVIVEAWVVVILGVFFHNKTEGAVKFAATAFSNVIEATNQNTKIMTEAFIDLREVVVPLAVNILYPKTKA